MTPQVEPQIEVPEIPPEAAEWVERINAVPVDVRKHVVYAIMATHLRGALAERDLEGILLESLGADVWALGIIVVDAKGLRFSVAVDKDGPRPADCVHVLELIESAMDGAIRGFAPGQLRKSTSTEPPS